MKTNKNTKKVVKAAKKPAPKAKAQPMKIAILSFGKLMKNSKGLVATKWTQKGPKLPVEFCRISKDGRLTLALSKQNGVANHVYFAVAKGKTLKSVIPEVAEREKLNEKHLGIVDLRNEIANEKATDNQEVSREIATWGKKHKFDAVIWNGLQQRFKDVIGVAYSPGSAISYINGLPTKTRNLAKAYIKNAPKGIETPFRTIWTEIED